MTVCVKGALWVAVKGGNQEKEMKGEICNEVQLYGIKSWYWERNVKMIGGGGGGGGEKGEGMFIVGTMKQSNVLKRRVGRGEKDEIVKRRENTMGYMWDSRWNWMVAMLNDFV